MDTLALSVWCVVIVFILTGEVQARSKGDSAKFYRSCVYDCFMENCAGGRNESFHQSQPVSERLLQWSCEEDCRYQCMWPTVDNFTANGSPVPKFHGKWPFIRVLGCQEPASTVFSILNGATNVYMMKVMINTIPRNAPLFMLWIIGLMVSLNAWVWSTVFHSRDTPITEKLDYFSALGYVQFMLFGVLTRFLRKKPNWIIGCLFTVLLLLFAHHVYYMGFVKFDYGYNMKINVISGIVNACIWLSWCATVRKKQPYVWKAVTAILSTSILLLLELGDFPPVFWVFDAHSLWHAGTVPLPLLFYSFAIDDCLHLLDEEKAIPLRTKLD